MKNSANKHSKMKMLFLNVMTFPTLLALFGFMSRHKEKVSSVETVTLTLRGMRGSLVYKTEAEDEKTKLSRYRQVFLDGEDILRLEASAVCDSASFIELMNRCNVACWDGFHGKHPRNVHDGMMFDFSACINGGKTIKADGSANFPKGYHEFVRELNTMLAKQA